MVGVKFDKTCNGNVYDMPGGIEAAADGQDVVSSDGDSFMMLADSVPFGKTFGCFALFVTFRGLVGSGPAI